MGAEYYLVCNECEEIIWIAPHFLAPERIITRNVAFFLARHHLCSFWVGDQQCFSFNMDDYKELDPDRDEPLNRFARMAQEMSDEPEQSP